MNNIRKNIDNIEINNLNNMNKYILNDNNIINNIFKKCIVKENVDDHSLGSRKSRNTPPIEVEKSISKLDNILDIVFRYKNIFFPLLYYIDVKITNTIFTLYYITSKN